MENEKTYRRKRIARRLVGKKGKFYPDSTYIRSAIEIFKKNGGEIERLETKRGEPVYPACHHLRLKEI